MRHFIRVKPLQLGILAIAAIGSFGCAAVPLNRQSATVANIEEHNSVKVDLERYREQAAQMARYATTDPYNPSWDNPFNHR